MFVNYAFSFVKFLSYCIIEFRDLKKQRDDDGYSHKDIPDLLENKWRCVSAFYNGKPETFTSLVQTFQTAASSTPAEMFLTIKRMSLHSPQTVFNSYSGQYTTTVFHYIWRSLFWQLSSCCLRTCFSEVPIVCTACWHWEFGQFSNFLIHCLHATYCFLTFPQTKRKYSVI